MVNEINKPSENVRLGERLAESNRQLLAMQEEHQRLVLEMDMLRHRATELQRRNAQQLDGNNNESMAESADVAANTTESTTEESRVNVAETVEAPTLPDIEQRQTNSGEQELSEKQENTSERDNDDEDPNYIRDKLAEIATLKAQYRRVQNIMNTTNMIEEHLKSKEHPSTGVTPAAAATTSSLTSTLSSTATSDEESSNSAMQTETKQNNNASTAAAPNNEKEELLSAMMNMFTDFTSDLRSQAENLRAERDRIRALKDELLNRKNAS